MPHAQPDLSRQAEMAELIRQLARKKAIPARCSMACA